MHSMSVTASHPLLDGFVETRRNALKHTDEASHRDSNPESVCPFLEEDLPFNAEFSECSIRRNALKHRDDTYRRDSNPESMSPFLAEDLPFDAQSSECSSRRNALKHLDETSRRNSNLESMPLLLEKELLSNAEFSECSTITDFDLDSDAASSSLDSISRSETSFCSIEDSDATSQQVAGSAKHLSQRRFRSAGSRVLKRFVKALESCDLVARVEASSGVEDCSVIVQVKDDGEGLIDSVSSFIQDALLDITSNSKCIFVMGYGSPDAFRTTTNGFEATLVAMQSTRRTINFRDGLCLGDSVYRMPVKVFVHCPRSS